MLEDLDFDAASVGEGEMIELFDGMEDTSGEDDDDESDGEEFDEKDLEEYNKMMRKVGVSGQKNGMGRMVDGKGNVMWDDGVDLDEDEDDEDAWVGDGTLEVGELEGLMNDAEGEFGDDDDDMEEDDEEEAEEESEEEALPLPPSKKSGKKSKESKIDTPRYALTEPTFTPSSKLNKKSHLASTSSSYNDTSDLIENDTDLGDPTYLHSSDASDKSQRNRSLRFHTNRIAQSSARKEAGRRRAANGGEGDEDLPYRDRNAGRDAAIRKSTGVGAGPGEDLEMGGEEVMEDMEIGKGKTKGKRGREENEDEAVAYYESVKRRKREEKEASKQAYDAVVAEEK